MKILIILFCLSFTACTGLKKPVKKTAQKKPVKESIIQSARLKLAGLHKSPKPDKKEILKALSLILKQTGRKNYQDRKQAFQIILKMSLKDLQRIKKDKHIAPVQDLIFYQLGKLLFRAEKFDESHRFFKKFLVTSIDSELEKKALKYIQAVESRKTINKKHIGLVLPLTGPQARIGQRLLKGFSLGLGFYTNKSSSFQLVVLDSEGLADKARKAVEKLVLNHHIIALSGGALSRTAQALAEEAHNFGVPALLVSQKSQLTKTGRYVFQNGLTSSLIASQLTNFLTDHFHFKNFALLYPNDSYGLDYANSFWQAVEQKKGVIQGAQTYKPGETDFNGAVQRLSGLYYKTDRAEEYKEQLKSQLLKNPNMRRDKEKALSAKNLLSPVVDFQVLFVPDSIKMLNLISSHLAYNDIKDVFLAGPSLWSQARRLKTKYIEKAFFADIELNSPNFKNTDFYKQFLKIFDHKPGLFELLSYESAMILKKAVLNGADSRENLRKKLKTTLFQGPAGRLSINKNREFERPLTIFKIENNKITPVLSANKAVSSI